MTAFDAADEAPVPTLFVAATVKVYAVPLVRPAKVVEVVLAPIVTVAPLLAVTV